MIFFLTAEEISEVHRLYHPDTFFPQTDSLHQPEVQLLRFWICKLPSPLELMIFREESFHRHHSMIFLWR